MDDVKNFGFRKLELVALPHSHGNWNIFMIELFNILLFIRLEVTLVDLNGQLLDVLLDIGRARKFSRNARQLLGPGT